MGKMPDSKGGRVNYSNADKEIFMDIMKNADGGKLFTVVMSGTTTNDMKHRTWQRVSELFKNNTGLEVNTEQCRRLFTRMKAEEKQRHDYEINKSFMSQCSKTGGGPSPDVPPEIDGDQIDTASTLDFLDPTKTPWNSLTMMSECLYGVWKARFPILKNLRTDFPLSQKIVVATAVLFNIARTWHDEDVGGEEDEEDGDSDREDDVLNNVVVHDAAQAHVRMRGKILRDRLKDEMPP